MRQRGRQLAKVFCAKHIDGLKAVGVELPHGLPTQWIVHYVHVGTGLPALKYLSRYLYRGVIQDPQIVAVDRCAGTVTFRYQDGKTKQPAYRTLAVVEFVQLLLRHALPKGYRRVRDFGFMHSNAKRLLILLQWVLKVVIQAAAPRTPRPFLCPHCHVPMRAIGTTSRSAATT